VYFSSDVIEGAQGDCTTFRLSLTYVGAAAIPLFVLGLYAVQRPRIGRLGLCGAIAYAYSYVFFTTTVVYALAAKTPNWTALGKVFGGWMTVHGLIMFVGGLMFGLAVIRAAVLARWTGECLMVGVVLVVTASGMPNIARTVQLPLRPPRSWAWGGRCSKNAQRPDFGSGYGWSKMRHEPDAGDCQDCRHCHHDRRARRAECGL
jgi:hypothetical protein